MLSPEQVKSIKKQLISHLENQDYSEDQREEAIAQIESMSPEELESFLIKNKMLSSSENGDSETNEGMSCIFCQISSGKIPSYKIAENPSALAVLEINPLSHGHIIIIPKSHITQNNITIELEDFAKGVSELMKKRLDVKKVHIQKSEMFNHGIINIIPLYSDEIPSERKKASEDDLKKLQEIIITKEASSSEDKPKEKKVKKEKAEKKVREPKPKKSHLEKYPRRIP